MDYQQILAVAENRFKEEFSDIIKDLKDLISSGSTGGEISSMVGKYLKDLKAKNPNAYGLIENEIRLYLLECKKHGLIIK